MTSGVRLDTSAATTRGFGVAEFQEVGHIIGDVLDGLGAGDSASAEQAVKQRVGQLCRRFPIYG